ncbi:MAG: TerB family tellurite resistance protein [Venatoribacter sp.]
MIEKLLALFKQPQAARPQQELDLAVAVLLTEIMKADHELDEREINTLKKVLSDLFQQDKTSIDNLVIRAKQQSDQANDLFQFTEAINQHWQADDKYKLVQGLWRVAFSDARLDKYEEYMIRRISDLLYLPHSEFIRAKLSVKPKP